MKRILIVLIGVLPMSAVATNLNGAIRPSESAPRPSTPAVRPSEPAARPTERAVSPSTPTNLYVVIAIEDEDPSDYYAASNVSVSFVRRATRSEAEVDAMKSCRSISSNPSKCRVFDHFNSGCRYVATGSTPWGGSGWGAAPTPQGAYDQCAIRKLNCQVPVVGGCANPQDDLPRDAIKLSPKLRYWGALAAGRAETSSKHHVAVATAAGRSEEDAKLRAVHACNSSSSHLGMSCEAVSTFNTGCGYISRGESYTGTGPLPWGTGVTKQRAYDNCFSVASAGGQCSTKPLGFCIEN